MEKERNITLTGTGPTEGQKPNHCIEAMPWVTSGQCLKSRQRGVQSWQRLGAPPAEWEGRDSELKQTTGVRMAFYMSEDYKTYRCVRVYQCSPMVQINRNWTKGSHSTKLQTQAARTPTVTWMIPSGPRLLLSSCSFRGSGEVPCSLAPTSLGHMVVTPTLQAGGPL